VGESTPEWRLDCVEMRILRSSFVLPGTDVPPEIARRGMNSSHVNLLKYFRNKWKFFPWHHVLNICK
jgi:hypothetical protein